MEAMTKHGAFSWFELSTTDPAQAVSFYRDLFGWTVDGMDMGGSTYHVVQVGDTSVAGIAGAMPGAPPKAPSWSCYITVDDVDQAAKRVLELGGKLLVEPLDIPTIGRFAVCQDPQGAVFNVITYQQGTGGP